MQKPNLRRISVQLLPKIVLLLYGSFAWIDIVINKHIRFGFLFVCFVFVYLFILCNFVIIVSFVSSSNFLYSFPLKLTNIQQKCIRDQKQQRFLTVKAVEACGGLYHTQSNKFAGKLA